MNQKRETRDGILFILPGFIGFLFFVFLPVIMSLYLSFTDWNFLEGVKAIKFTGLQNYGKLASDQWFKDSLVNNLKFTVETIPVCVILGMIFAYIIDRHIFLSKTVRTMMFVPYIASTVAVCIVWMVLFQPSYGPVNMFLKSLGVQDLPKWLSSKKWAMRAIVIIYIWQELGYFIIVFMAGLKSISSDIYEAASIDGASSAVTFFKITVPLLSPTTFFLSVMGIIGSFKVFDHISVLTQGGPGSSTSVMAFYIYKAAFEQYKTGYSNTLAWVLFALIFIVTMIQWKLQKKYSNE
jgi:multiple sugar transport system permease protein